MAQRKVRPTHFISLPLGTGDAAFRQRVEHLTQRICSADPIPSGFHPSIVIPSQRLHLTVAVCALRCTHGTAQDPQAAGPLDLSTQLYDASNGASSVPSNLLPTREDAISLLQSCRDELRHVLHGRMLRVRLAELGTFSTKHDKCHVLFARPSDPPDSPGLLAEVSALLHRRFKEAGYLSDHRPLDLHCTLLNTSKRRQHSIGEETSGTARGGGRRRKDRGRMPFDGRILLDLPREDQDLGVVEVEAIQLCAMATFDETGAYRCLDSIPLHELTAG